MDCISNLLLYKKFQIVYGSRSEQCNRLIWRFSAVSWSYAIHKRGFIVGIISSLLNISPTQVIVWPFKLLYLALRDRAWYIIRVNVKKHDTSPLIDVCLQIYIFFLISSKLFDLYSKIFLPGVAQSIISGPNFTKFRRSCIHKFKVEIHYSAF